MTVEDLNNLPKEKAREELIKCCGSSAWVEQIVESRPFENKVKLFESAKEIWYTCKPADWLEAFQHHPKIGDRKSLENKFASTKEWASNEQRGVETSGKELLDKLAMLNEAYEKRFGYIFIVCATGKTAAEMTALLEERIKNVSEDEIKIAMAEQDKITKIRLEKLLS